MTRRRFEGALAALVLFAATPGTAFSEQSGADPAAQIAALEQELGTLEKRTQFILDQYGRDVQTGGITELERRFSEAELHFLLENSGASTTS